MIRNILNNIEAAVKPPALSIKAPNPLPPLPSKHMGATDLIHRVASKLEAPKIAEVRASFPPDKHFHGSFLRSVANAYNYHQPISIAPHDLWYIVLTEIARTINEDPEQYRSIFTKNPEKILIAVQSPTGILPIDEIIQRLAELVPVDIDLFIPEFTTYDKMSLAATLGAFASATKAYYNYGTYMCGIPEIELRGRLKDWELVSEHARDLAELFKDTALHAYLRKIWNCAIWLWWVRKGVPDNAIFSLFTSKNIGSGGQLEIDGWLPQEFFMIGGGHKIENYPNTWSLVPFLDLPTQRKFTDVYGCFYSEIEDGFSVAKYGRITFEMEG